MVKRTRRRARRPKAVAIAKAAAAEPARTIVYVHGIGNKPTESILKCQWDHALFGFDLGERSRLASWVNREFYPEPSEGTCVSGDRISLDEEIAMSIRALAPIPIEEEAALIAETPKAKKVLKDLARSMESRAQAASARITAANVGAKVLPLPASLRKLITRGLVRAFLRDVNDYFFVKRRREVMRESLLARLRVGGGPFIVIGHSQGSMIAYDALSSVAPKDADVALFVTIGSPLGIAEVQDQVKDLTGHRLRVPMCVRRWLNVAEPLDPVSLDESLSGEFEGDIEDEPVRNPDSPRHPHSGSGYLQTSVVRTAVRATVDTALFQPVASFVIARDLIRQMENCPPAVRNKVLIELVDPTDAKGRPLDEIRKDVVTRIRAGSKASEEDLQVEPLKRFVAARLTREETESLAGQGVKGLTIKRIWRNATKRALLDISAQTAQVTAAQSAYKALGRGIAWAVLDTGLSPSHPHFKPNNIGPQYDCTKRGELVSGEAPDHQGHGTHVAGIIAGSHEVPGEPLRQFTGMAAEATLHTYKVLNDDGEGEDAWIIKALDHISSTNEKAGTPVIQGVNLSLGGGFDQSVYGCGHSPLCRELRRLWRQGVVVVIAAGNEGFSVLQTLDGTVDANMDLSIGDPANLDEAIAVGSTHKANPHTFGISYFSSRGPTADGRQKPDLVAPGERILSCRHRLKAGAKTVEDLYVEMSGTSMAAPHVSGLIAAFLSVRREFIGYPERVKEILLDNCTDLKRDRPQQGSGMPNLVKMLVNT